MKKGKIFSTLLLVGVMFVVCYLTLPACNIRSVMFWLYCILAAVCLAVLLIIVWQKETLALFAKTSKEEDYLYERHFKVLVAPAIILVLVFMVGLASSWNLFHAEAARDVAKVETVESFQEGFPDLLESDETLNNLPIVDYDTAKLLGDKKIAGIKDATWYEVDDEYNLIKYQDGYYRLSTIDYGSFFKYMKARHSGVPGYVLVDVVTKNDTITQEAQIVLTEQPIKYSPGAFFSHDLKRHLRSQYLSDIFGKSYLEIDEEGTPYWVTSVMEPTKGLFGVKVVKSFILTNAETGESEKMDLDEALEWIDHILPLKYLMKIAHQHYAYVNGYMNNLLSKTGVYRTAYYYKDKKQNDEDSEAGIFANFHGYSSIVGPDGDILFYTGLTAANNAESNLGWLVIDTRTGEMKQYDVVGAEESAAQAAVEAIVQAQRWEATFPLPVNIAGEPSYLMALKGKSGLVQGYSLVNVENHSLAVFSDTLEGTIEDYLEKLGKEKEQVVIDKRGAEEETGVISAIYTAEIDGTTQFYYVINDELYRSPITINEMQVLFSVGDEVSFEATETRKGMKVITRIKK